MNKSNLSRTPYVQVYTLSFYFLRVYNLDVCFILLLRCHSVVQMLDLDCTPVQVGTITNITLNFTKIHFINFNEN